MQKERSTGPRVARDERVDELRQELRRLAARRDELEPLLCDVRNETWEQRLAEYQLLGSSIYNLRRRIHNVMEGEPELGHAVPQEVTQHHRSRTS